jgi:hypothetical protein
MKLFDIWSEGYNCTGNSSPATFHGNMYGENLLDACVKFAEETPEFKKYFDHNENGDCFYWGCKIYNNLAEACESFG